MAKFVQKSNYEATHLDDEWIILNTEEFTVTKLNEVGGYCWSLLKEEQTVESLVKAVDQRFRSENKISEGDIEEFLSDLWGCGLVTNVI